MRNNQYLIYPLAVLFYWALLFTTGCKKDDKTAPVLTVTDVDGNLYHTVTIGTQTWMVENLKTTHYRNGDPIAHPTNEQPWINLTTGGYVNYQSHSNVGDTLGRLYNWYVVAEGPFLAPEGWHIPSDVEWTTLINYLGGLAVAGGKLKQSGTSNWNSPNTDATNESGFTALAGGYRDELGWYYFKGDRAAFWSSSEANNESAWYYLITYNESQCHRLMGVKANTGRSVRCIKD
jgi:uncharacterized protein (TIGR02145 family)